MGDAVSTGCQAERPPAGSSTAASSAAAPSYQALITSQAGGGLPASRGTATGMEAAPPTAMATSAWMGSVPS
ncbi:MAG TPA: hypothetical protein PKE47_01440, partial [Verrucomicrobiota bacterium]|nr:hypothetical protein [Verrucomicrobiota bacterium]